MVKGVSRAAVHEAIKTGRLKNSLRKDKNDKWEIDQKKADIEWEQNTKHHLRHNAKDPKLRYKQQVATLETITPEIKKTSKSDVSVPRETKMHIAEASRVKEEFSAKMAQLKYFERAGELVDVKKVQNESFKIARIVRDSLMNIPERISAELAGTNDTVVIHQKLTEEIRKVLEGLPEKFESELGQDAD